MRVIFIVRVLYDRRITKTLIELRRGNCYAINSVQSSSNFQYVLPW